MLMTCRPTPTAPLTRLYRLLLKCAWLWMPSLLGWPLIVYYLTLPRPNLSGWEVADVWLVLTSPLLPLPFHTFAFKIQSETWGSFLTKSLASPCTSTSSLAPAIISSASCELCLTLCPAAALVHAFVTSRLDRCSSILAGLPLALNARVDRVLRCAARLIGRIPKYGSVSAYMRDMLHWLPIAQRISYRIAVFVWRCLLGNAPGYLCELCRQVFGLPGWRALRSSVTRQLLVPRHCLVLKLQLGSIAHSPLLAPPPGMASPWKSVSCLKIMKVRFAGCLRLICIAVVRLGAPLSRFLEGAPYKFLNK